MLEWEELAGVEYLITLSAQIKQYLLKYPPSLIS